MKKKVISLFIGLSLLFTSSTAVSAATVGTTSAKLSENSIVATTEIGSDIGYQGNNVVLDNEIDSIVNKLRDYIKSNPNASNSQLNAYAESLLSKTAQNSSTGIMKTQTNGFDMNGYITGMLNSLEQELYNSNKAKALLCMANGKLAIGYAEDNYISSVLHNGNGDAFRHCLWNFGMAIDVGQSFAKKWSDAHENGTSNNPALEKSMDLYNNSIGLKLAQDNPTTILHSTFIKKSKENCRNGNLKIISNGKLVKSTSSGEK